MIQISSEILSFYCSPAALASSGFNDESYSQTFSLSFLEWSAMSNAEVETQIKTLWRIRYFLQDSGQIEKMKVLACYLFSARKRPALQGFFF